MANYMNPNAPMNMQNLANMQQFSNMQMILNPKNDNDIQNDPSGINQ